MLTKEKRALARREGNHSICTRLHAQYQNPICQRIFVLSSLRLHVRSAPSVYFVFGVACRLVHCYFVPLALPCSSLLRCWDTRAMLWGDSTGVMKNKTARQKQSSNEQHDKQRQRQTTPTMHFMAVCGAAAKRVCQHRDTTRMRENKGARPFYQTFNGKLYIFKTPSKRFYNTKKVPERIWVNLKVSFQYMYIYTFQISDNFIKLALITIDYYVYDHNCADHRDNN